MDKGAGEPMNPEKDAAIKTAAIRGDIAQTRADMSRTVDQIEQRLSPAHFKEQVADLKETVLGEYLGQEIVLGIRPENMQDAELAHGADAQAIIKLPVKLREELGSEVQIHGAIGTAAHVSGGEAEDVRSLATMVARMNPKTAIREGDVARVLVDTEALHFFDRESGKSLRS